MNEPEPVKAVPKRITCVRDILPTLQKEIEQFEVDTETMSKIDLAV